MWLFFFSSRRRHTRLTCDWSSDVCSSDLSPLVTIQDLTDNASERNFGIALDRTGLTVASHGLQSYFASVSDPFHLRLQGKIGRASCREKCRVRGSPWHLKRNRRHNERAKR